MQYHILTNSQLIAAYTQNVVKGLKWAYTLLRIFVGREWTFVKLLPLIIRDIDSTDRRLQRKFSSSPSCYYQNKTFALLTQYLDGTLRCNRSKNGLMSCWTHTLRGALSPSWILRFSTHVVYYAWAVWTSGVDRNVYGASGNYENEILIKSDGALRIRWIEYYVQSFHSLCTHWTLSYGSREQSHEMYVLWCLAHDAMYKSITRVGALKVLILHSDESTING